MNLVGSLSSEIGTEIRAYEATSYTEAHGRWKTCIAVSIAAPRKRDVPGNNRVRSPYKVGFARSIRSTGHCHRSVAI